MTARLEDAGHINALWAALLLEELWRLGLRDVCIAPGSRSAPLTLAAAAHEGLAKHLHFDERGLGFLALGLAKASGRPVAVITTSGTAVANLYPAVIEARLTGVPLLLLTADRPPELLDCGANQAITQPGLFADYPVHEQDLPAPDTRLPAQFLLASLDQAWLRLTTTPGPVHLNCRYPEPLYPVAEAADFAAYLAPLSAWQQNGMPWQTCRSPQAAVTSEPDWSAFSGQPGLILAGRIDDPAEAAAVARLAADLGWPLLADIQSQLRFHPLALGHYDLALHSATCRRELGRARVLLQFGARFVSKRLHQFVAAQPWQDYWQVTPSPDRLDNGLPVRRRLVAPIGAWCRAHAAPPRPTWHRLPALLAPLPALLADELAGFSEAAVCHRLGARLKGQLMLGNSLAPRLLDMLALPGPGPQRVFSNRGASGIDGLIATAAGVALAAPASPTTLLLGDTSALHDLNSLALLARLPSPFVLVLLNNDGGSIFRLLPVPEQDGVLDHYYRLPHGLDFAHAAAQFGLNYQAPTTLADFEAAYSQALAGGRTLLEIRVPSQQVAEELGRLAHRCRTLHGE